MLPPATRDLHRILVVDDDADLRALIMGQLDSLECAVRGVGGRNEAEEAVRLWRPSVVVLDLSLPDGDGLELCRRWRTHGSEAAVIMVTARSSAVDRILGLEIGADDYLTKPFEPRELVARVRNLLRRRQEAPAGGSARSADFAGWRLDLVQRRLIDADGAVVLLSAAEFRLLRRFIEAPRRVLSREALLPERRATVAFDRSLDVQVSRLRQKLAGAASDDTLILTVRNEGYLFTADVVFQ